MLLNTLVDLPFVLGRWGRELINKSLSWLGLVLGMFNAAQHPCGFAFCFGEMRQRADQQVIILNSSSFTTSWKGIMASWLRLSSPYLGITWDFSNTSHSKERSELDESKVLWMLSSIRFSQQFILLFFPLKFNVNHGVPYMFVPGFPRLSTTF
jgi:hypothetical protein